MPSDEPTGGPAASDAAGQQPSGGDSQPTPPTTPAASGGGDASAQSEIQNPAAKAAAEEAARYRRQVRDMEKRLAEFEAAQKAAEDAKLSDLQREQKRASEAQERASAASLALQESRIENAVLREATKVGLDAELARRLIDASEIEFDDAGRPENMAKLLEKLVKQYPQLVTPAAPSSPQAPPAAQVGATNAPRASGPILINASQYSDPEFKKQFIRDYGEDVLTALNKGRAKIV